MNCDHSFVRTHLCRKMTKLIFILEYYRSLTRHKEKTKGKSRKPCPPLLLFFFSYWNLGLSGLKMSNSQANQDALGILQIAFVPSTH